MKHPSLVMSLFIFLLMWAFSESKAQVPKTYDSNGTVHIMTSPNSNNNPAIRDQRLTHIGIEGQMGFSRDRKPVLEKLVKEFDIKIQFYNAQMRYAPALTFLPTKVEKKEVVQIYVSRVAINGRPLKAPELIAVGKEISLNKSGLPIGLGYEFMQGEQSVVLDVVMVRANVRIMTVRLSLQKNGEVKYITHGLERPN